VPAGGVLQVFACEARSCLLFHPPLIHASPGAVCPGGSQFTSLKPIGYTWGTTSKIIQDPAHLIQLVCPNNKISFILQVCTGPNVRV
jgi:hypothetical protein